MKGVIPTGLLDCIRRLFQLRLEPSPEYAKKKYGTHGRLEIPELHISVPLYDAHDGNQQEIVDEPQSAVYMRWGQQGAIADHSNQDRFSNLNRVRPWHTIATIDRQSAKEKFRCYRTQVGHIRTAEGANRIFDSGWKPVYAQNPGGLCIYTCIGRSAEDVMDVCLTYWLPVAEEEVEKDG